MIPQPQSDSRLQTGAAGVIHDTNYLESFCDEDFPSIGKVQKQKDCASKDHVYPGVYENVYYRHSNTSSHTRKFLLSIIVVIHILVLCVVAVGIWIKYSHSNAASELLNAEEAATSWNQVEQPYTSHGSHLISDSTETSGDTTASRNREQPVSNEHQSPTHAYWSLLERAFNIQRTFLIQLSKLKNYMEPDDIEQLITQYKTSELQNEAMDLSIFVYELVALWGGVPMDEMMTFGNYVCAEGVLAMKVGLITDKLSDSLYSHPGRQLTLRSFMTTVEKVLTSTNELQRSVFEKVLEVANSLKDADFNWWARENMHRMDLSKQIDSKIELILSHVIFGNESIFKKGDIVDFVHHTRDLQRNLRDQLMLLKLSFNKRINSIQTNPTQIPSNASETPSEDVPGTGAAYVTSASLIQALYSDVLQGVTRELTMFVRLLRSSPLHAGTLQKVLSSYEQSIAQRFQGFTTFMTKVVLVHAGLSFVELEEFRDLARDVDSRCKQELATSVGDSNPLEGIPSAQEYMKEFLRLVKDESKMERAFVRGLGILKSRLPEDSASGMSNSYMEFIQNNTFHQQIFFLKQQIIAQWPGLTSYERLNIERGMSAIELYNKTLFTYLFSWLNSAPHA